MDHKKNIKKEITNGISNVFKNIKKTLKKIKINKKVGIAILAVLLLFIIVKILTPSSDYPKYPIVIEDVEGDLFVYGTNVKKEEDAIKIASKGSANLVKYAHNTNRYVLFQKEANLYLYDARKKGETKKILNNVSGSNYDFSEDDKYVIALDESNNLKVYNYKDAKKVETGVKSIVAIKGDYILFEKDNDYYVRSIKPSKDDKKKVSEVSSYNISFSEDGKYIIYITKENELHRYNIKKNKDSKISNNVTNFYCDKDDCKTMYYVFVENGKFLYYYDGKKDTRLAEDIFAVLAYDVANKKVVYSKANGNKFVLYYQKGSKDPAKIDEGLDIVKATYLVDNDIYYLTADNKLKFAKISGKKISRKLTVSSDVFGTIHEYKKGFAYITNINSNNYSGNLYLAKNGKAKKIDEKVSTNIKVNSDGTRVYYIKDFGGAGELYYTKGGKGKLVDTKVHAFQYIRDNLIYLVKDYNSSKVRGDLYRYTNKSVKIADNITGISNIPVSYKRK